MKVRLLSRLNLSIFNVQFSLLNISPNTMLRVGYLYGSFGDNNSVKVECIYEPPQETSDTSFTLLDDPKADRVTALAGLLGLRKVGWIFAHPPREEK